MYLPMHKPHFFYQVCNILYLHHIFVMLHAKYPCMTVVPKRRFQLEQVLIFFNEGATTFYFCIRKLKVFNCRISILINSVMLLVIINLKIFL